MIFNLLTTPWGPVRRADGSPDRITPDRLNPASDFRKPFGRQCRKVDLATSQKNDSPKRLKTLI